jgi:hypothetical protein
LFAYANPSQRCTKEDMLGPITTLENRLKKAQKIGQQARTLACDCAVESQPYTTVTHAHRPVRTLLVHNLRRKSQPPE